MNKNMVKKIASESGIAVYNKDTEALIKNTILALLEDIEQWDTVHIEDGMVQRSHIGLEICKGIRMKYGVR